MARNRKPSFDATAEASYAGLGLSISNIKAVICRNYERENMPDPSTIKTAEELAEILKKYEDAESAILVYNEAGAAIKAHNTPYDAIKKTALALAEADLRVTGETKRVTNTGNCGWTKPQKPVLDEEAWKEAQREDRKMATIQRAFDNTEADLKLAQEPFLVLPAGRFYIK